MITSSFVGRWELDISLSDSMEPILKKQGVNPLLRGLISRANATQVVTQTNQFITIETHSLLGKKVEEIWIGSPPKVEEIAFYGKVSTQSYWKDEESSLVTVYQQEVKSGSRSTLITRRWIEEEEMMIQEVIYQNGDEPELIVKRIFRRLS